MTSSSSRSPRTMFTRPWHWSGSAWRTPSSSTSHSAPTWDGDRTGRRPRPKVTDSFGLFVRAGPYLALTSFLDRHYHREGREAPSPLANPKRESVSPRDPDGRTPP